MSTITASLINLTNSTPQNGHLSTQPKNPARCPLDPLAQQAKSVLIPITKRELVHFRLPKNAVTPAFITYFSVRSSTATAST